VKASSKRVQLSTIDYQHQDLLVWVDLEMTGLDPQEHVIIELACVLTDPSLKVVAEGPHIVIHYPDEILQKADEWSYEHHSKSGLLDLSRRSSIDLKTAEEEIVEFLAQYIKPKTSPLCGNSVWQDRRFLIKYMPKFESFLHYRIVDVSTIKELVRRWYPTLPEFKKKKSHNSLADIYESIAELMYYREHVFVRP